MSIKSLGGADALALHQLSAPDTDAIRMSKDQLEASKAFEGYMVEMMVKEMRKTVPDGMFSGGQAEIFSNLFDQEIAARIAEGGGFGFGDMLAGQMVGSGTSDAAPSFARIAEYSRVPKAPGGAATLPVADGVITSHFGHRSDPFHGKRTKHKGLDIAAAEGTPIQPIRPGIVTSAGKRGGYGNVIVVDHGDGTTSLYAHCAELKAKKGQRVGRGDIIATVGSTGRSTGPHLHLEVHQNGTAINPMAVLEPSVHGHDHDHDHAHDHAHAHDHDHGHDGGGHDLPINEGPTLVRK